MKVMDYALAHVEDEVAENIVAPAAAANTMQGCQIDRFPATARGCGGPKAMPVNFQSIDNHYVFYRKMLAGTSTIKLCKSIVFY
jgi:hypothetical protein